MSFKLYLGNSLKCIICLTGLIATFYTVMDLMYFLSYPNYNKIKYTTDVLLNISWSLIVDMALLSLFILQHSLMASDNIKTNLARNHFQDIYRSFYILTTTISLQILFKYWHPIPNLVLWNIDLNNKFLFIFYCILHFIAWTIIYVGNICMDVNELLGLKQVYYNIVNLPDPNSRKSANLRRLNSHMRHPSFLAFIIIFWLIPIMSLDRLLLASIFTSYMYITWNTDDMDYIYQKSQYQRKFFELETLRD